MGPSPAGPPYDLVPPLARRMEKAADAEGPQRLRRSAATIASH
jgi:hypothetical protein